MRRLVKALLELRQGGENTLGDWRQVGAPARGVFRRPGAARRRQRVPLSSRSPEARSTANCPRRRLAVERVVTRRVVGCALL